MSVRAWGLVVLLVLVVGASSVLLFRYVFASDGSGTNVVSPASVTAGSAGNAPTFTFTAAESMSSGEVAVTVPAEWTAPQATAGVPGYTTATSSGVVADVLNALDSASGWAATRHMALSIDAADKQEGIGSLANAVFAPAAAGEQWHVTYGSASNWGTAAIGNLRVGMWVKSSVGTSAGDISWQDDDSAALASPIDTVALPALTADTWKYTSVTLGAASRASVLSYGFRYTNDIGPMTFKADALSTIFSANDVTTGWGSDAKITRSALTTSGNFMEGTGSVRCSYADGAGIGSSGDCFDNEGAVIPLGPGTTVSLWVRSSVALNAGDFAFTTDDSGNLASPEDVVSLPALAANTWTYVTLTAPNSADARSFGVRQLVDKGTMTIDIDAMGKRIDAADAIDGWTAPTSSVQSLSSDTGTVHEGTASLRNDVSASAAAGDAWYETFGSPRDWSGYTTAGFWIRSTVATTAGQLKFEYSAAADLSSPIASVNVGALSANTWTYQTFALSGSRGAVRSYGVNYAADIGAATIHLDDVLIGPGVPTFPGGGVVSARLLSLAPGQTVTLAYGSGGGASGATAPTAAGVSTFLTRSRVSDAGSLQSISTSPTITVVPGPTSVYHLTDPGGMTAGTRLGYSVSRTDAYGNAVTAGAETVYLFSDSAGNEAFYAAAEGGSPVASVAIADGSSSADFWYYDDRAGSAAVTASDNASAPDGAAGVDDAADVVGVSPAATASYALNDPGDTVVGARIGYAVTRRDAFGNAATNGVETAYLFSGGSGTFFDAPSGGSTISSVSFSDGSASADFWFSDVVVEAVTVTVSDNASAPDGEAGVDDAQDGVSVGVAPASRFVILQPASTAVGEIMEVTVRAEDGFGNVDLTYQDDVTLNASGSATGAGLVDVVDGVGTIEISDTVVETVRLSLEDTESTGLDVSSTRDAVFTTGPTRLFEISDPGDAAAGTRLAYVVTRRDAFGNFVTSGTDVAYLYSDSEGNHAFYDAAEAGGQVTSVSIGSGSSEAVVWYADEKAGTATVTASDNAVAPDGLAGIDDATDVTVVLPGSAARFLLSDPGDATAGERLGYVVTRVDAYGNPTASGHTLVSLYADDTALFYDVPEDGFSVTSVSIPDGESEAAFWYAGERAGVHAVTVSDDPSEPNGPIGINDASDAVTVVAGPTFRFSLNDPGDMTVGTRLGYVVTRTDVHGNLVTAGSDAVRLYSDSTGGFAFYDAATDGNAVDTVSIGDGASTATFWYADDAGGTWRVTASDSASGPDGGTGIADGSDLVVVTTIPIIATRVVILNPEDAVAGQTVSVTLRAVDDFGSVDTTFEGAFELVRSGSATGPDSVAFVGGVGVAEISDTVAETVLLTLRDVGGTGLNADSSQDVVFAPGPTGRYALSDPGDTVAGTRVAYALAREDAYGNPVTSGGESVDLRTAFGPPAAFYESADGGPVTSVAFADGSSSVAFWYANERAAPDTVSASGAALASDDILVSPGPTARFRLDDPGDMTVGTRVAYALAREDAYGNAVTSGAATAYLSTTSTGGEAHFFDAASGGNAITSVAFADGQSESAFWYADTADGLWNVVASDASSPDGDTGIDDASDAVTVTTIPISATRFVIVDPADAVIGQSVTVTIRAEDDFGSVDTTFNGAVTLQVSGSATGGGEVAFLSGIGTALVSDAVPETVELTLVDSDETGLDATSSARIQFTAAGGGGGTGAVGPEVSVPVVVAPPPTVLRVGGVAYPGATVMLVGVGESQSLTLVQGSVSSADGTFTLEYDGPFEGLQSFEVVVTDPLGVPASRIAVDPEIVPETTTEQSVVAAPTVQLLQRAVLRGSALSVSGFATPGAEVQLAVDADGRVETARAREDGSYRLFVDTSSLAFGLHALRAQQVTPSGLTGVSAEPFVVLVSRVLNAGTDLNLDGNVDITDWSIFLVQWSSTDPAVRGLLDFNQDGTVDISDFSIFIRSIRS